MTAEKRDFANFNKFPGKTNEGTGIYEFPLLRYKDGADRIRKWQIFVRLVKNTEHQTTIDWNLLNEKQVEIKESYFDTDENYTDIPKGTLAEAWVENGIEGGKITRSIPTYFSEGAFEGRANQRNSFQQALIYARAQFLKRKEKGGTERKSASKKLTGNPGTIMYFPMLAKPFKDGEKYIKYPIYVQPKLDGVRCVSFLKKKNGGAENVVMYSRSKKEFPSMDYLKEALYPYLNDLFDEETDQSIYLDGELYKHGKKFQDISGESRNEKKRPDSENNSDNSNEYHIYDCFYPLELDIIYESRKEQLDEIFTTMKENNDTDAEKVIKSVETTLANDRKEVDSIFKKFVEEKYEGAILRNINGTYLANAQKTGAFMRSKNLVKMKKKFTDEFEIVGYTCGKRGKDKNALIWIAQTKNKVQFDVTPKDITYKERYKLYKDCKKHFDDKYLGLMLSVEYEDLSKNGVPQHAKAIGIRDYE